MLLKDYKFKYKILLSKDKLVKDWKVLIVLNLKGKPVFFNYTENLRNLYR